jgi:predicted nucleic acid-binding protein
LGLIYLDSSALVKLIAREKESDALFAFLEQRPERVSSILARIEVGRALRRAEAPPPLVQRADRLLRCVALIHLVAPIARLAAHTGPPELRSLDAIHLASALSVRDDLEVLVSYDRRLTSAAEAAGLHVAAPV